MGLQRCVASAQVQAREGGQHGATEISVVIADVSICTWLDALCVLTAHRRGCTITPRWAATAG